MQQIRHVIEDAGPPVTVRLEDQIVTQVGDLDVTHLGRAGITAEGGAEAGILTAETCPADHQRPGAPGPVVGLLEVIAGKGQVQQLQAPGIATSHPHHDGRFRLTGDPGLNLQVTSPLREAEHRIHLWEEDILGREDGVTGPQPGQGIDIPARSDRPVVVDALFLHRNIHPALLAQSLDEPANINTTKNLHHFSPPPSSGSSSL